MGVHTAARLLAAGVGLALVGAGLVWAQTPAAPPESAVPAIQVGTTLDNLETAFDAEKNGEALYEAYALQAEREGYRGVASLFRAAAKAEGVHARRQAQALSWLQAQARAELRRMTVGTTSENITAALLREADERNERYPAFLARARAERQTAAIRAFNYAEGAEDDHTWLLIGALNDLETLKTPVTYYVCQGCGKTLRSIEFKRCPTCFTPARKFERVS